MSQPAPRDFYDSEYHYEEDASRPDEGRIWRSLRKLEPLAGTTILDLGCGAGWAIRMATGNAKVGRAVGLDFSITGLKLAKKHSPNILWLQADGTALPLADATFDRLFCNGSLEHFPDVKQGIREIARVLKPAGRAVVIVPNFYVKTEQPMEFAASYWNWKKQFEAAGLKVESTGTDWGPPVFKNANLKRAVARLAGKNSFGDPVHAVSVRVRSEQKRLKRPPRRIMMPRLCFCSVLLCTLAFATAAPPATLPPAGYKLVWSDEFNTDGPLNPHDWSFEKGFVRNGEVQWYQPDNAVCASGMLVIEARRESKPNPLYKPGAKTWPASQPSLEYTSASIDTRGKHEWLYGRFEMRAKIDTRQGSWPAFWTLGKTGGWPACGEIDIMESYQHTLLANIAWAQHGGTNGSKWNTARTPLEKLAKDWSSQFHIWRMDWDADSIKLYCDDHLLNTQDLSQTLNPDGKNPFQQPLYLKLNQALGGTCGGDPSQTEFPIRFIIDYVRVYQKS